MFDYVALTGTTQGRVIEWTGAAWRAAGLLA